MPTPPDPDKLHAVERLRALEAEVDVARQRLRSDTAAVDGRAKLDLQHAVQRLAALEAEVDVVARRRRTEPP